MNLKHTITFSLCLLILGCSTLNKSSKDSWFGKEYTKAKLNKKVFKIPGNWVYVGADDESGQHFFENRTEATGFSYNSMKDYEFYDKSRSWFEQVEAYYEWEADYWRNQGLKVEELTRDKRDRYIIWKTEGEGTENMFLYGGSWEKFISVFIASSALSDEEKIQYLKRFYKVNQ